MIEYTDLLGCGYKNGARGENNLYDCYGLVLEIYNRLGISLPELGHAEDGRGRDKIYRSAVSSFKHIDTPADWCIVAFMIRPPFVSHVGVVLPDCKKFIHILQKSRVSIERLSAWQHKIAGYYLYEI